MSDYDAWEVKARRGFAKFDDDLHPRDRKGRWIETNALVSVWGGGHGTVVRNVGGGRLEVRMQDGSVQRVHRNYLTVQKRPDGSKPTSKASANPAAMKVEQASAEGRDFTPDTPDGRTPVKDLQRGQAVIVHGRASDPTRETTDDPDVRQLVGIVRFVEPDEGGGWRVRLAEVDEMAKPVDVYIADRDAVARVMPADKVAELTAAIRDGKPEAADIARALLADTLDEDDREAGARPAARPSVPELEQQIRDAYQQMVEPGRWLSMEDLRANLPGVDRAELDATLLRMANERKIVLVPESNQKTLTEAQRAAAVQQGGQDKHLVMVLADQPSSRQEAAQTPTPEPVPAKAPAAPQTVVPGDLQPGDRITFDVPVTAANELRFSLPGAKNPPKPGTTVTVRGVVEGVETDMFGNSLVHLRRRGAQWQSTGGGGPLDGDGLDWSLPTAGIPAPTSEGSRPSR
ncbi:hypothetical protein ACWCSD_48385, partial [Nonomuraea sp. NPDC001684]